MIAIDSASPQTSVHPSSFVVGNTANLVPRLTTFEGGAPCFNNVVARLSGVLNVKPSIVIPLANIYNTGSTPLWDDDNGGAFSYDDLTWELGARPIITGSMVTLSPVAPFTQDSVWFARHACEGVFQIRAWIDWLNANFPGKLSNVAGGIDFVADWYSATVDELGRPVARCPLFAFWIRSAASKPVVVMLSGFHAGETSGTSVLRIATEFLAGAGPESAALLNRFNFLFLPLINARGREAGFVRGNCQGQDANRHFDLPSPTFEEVEKPRALLLRECPNGAVAVIDWHSNLLGASTDISCYNIGSALEAQFWAALQAREGFNILSNGGSPGNGVAITWALNALGAKLSQVIEVNDMGSLQEKASLAHYAQAAMLALYDVRDALAPPVVVQPPTGVAVTFDEVLAATVADAKQWTPAQRAALRQAAADPVVVTPPPATQPAGAVSPSGTVMPPAPSITTPDGIWTMPGNSYRPLLLNGVRAAPFLANQVVWKNGVLKAADESRWGAFDTSWRQWLGNGQWGPMGSL